MIGFKKHEQDWKNQYDTFRKLWDDPPDESLVIAEDAGKKFVFGGKACAHVMVLRYKKEGLVHEQHYFFCITSTAKPSVTRSSIAQSWLTLNFLKVIGNDIKKIYVFHDGGTNEYNNSSGLFLYSLLQRLLIINYNYSIPYFIYFLGCGISPSL